MMDRIRLGRIEGVECKGAENESQGQGPGTPKEAKSESGSPQSAAPPVLSLPCRPTGMHHTAGRRRRTAKLERGAPGCPS